MIDNIGILVRQLLMGIIISLVIIVVVVIQNKFLMLKKSPRIQIFKEGQFIYTGNKACIEVKSIDDMTNVHIREGFMCIFPGKYIVGKNIEIRSLE